MKPRATTHHKMTPDSVKLCALCGALNHKDNVECWTCRWHGAFSADAATVALAWRRLEHQFEEVRKEHVTARDRPALDEFGTPRPVPGWRKLSARCRAWWIRIGTARDLRMAQRAARLRPRTPSEPGGLGV